jgi:hypothetical protein
MSDETLNRRIAEVEQQAKTRFGSEAWETALSAVSRATGGGITADAMKEILKTPDPGNLLFTACREQLLNEADAGSKDSEYAYSKIREKERENHRRLKGR